MDSFYVMFANFVNYQSGIMKMHIGVALRCTYDGYYRTDGRQTAFKYECIQHNGVSAYTPGRTLGYV